MSEIVQVDDLDAAIEEYKSRGFRLDMIFPVDNPREAVLSEPPAVAGGLTSARPIAKERESPSVRLIGSKDRGQPRATADDSGWIRGRAGMEYRDLIPDRLGGKVIASHIRLVDGGPVPDYVHYHKIYFQVIYCKKGRIKVVYEDQGEPFWLETGDLVLQPPEIRHRVLECTAGAEVIEITSPAEHETWVDHVMNLPCESIDRERSFGGQRFFRYIKGQDAATQEEAEKKLIDIARALSQAGSDHEVRDIVLTFSRSLCQS